MAQLAFPKAVGPAREVTGGKNGIVRYVTNNNDSGTGSFRTAVSDDVPAIVVFLVGGFFNLSSDIFIGSNKTILGAVCPGNAPTFRYRAVRIGSGKTNVILRYIRSRLGDTLGFSIDAFTASNATYFIVDHCSMSWSIDEILSTVSNCGNYSIQYCMITEALHSAGHVDGAPHGFGGIVGTTNISFFKNIMAHFWERGPLIDGGADVFDMRNCLIYNWGQRPTRGGSLSKSNLVKNYFKPGPATTRVGVGSEVPANFLFPTGDGSLSQYGKFYLEGNLLEGKDLGTTVDEQWGGVRLQNSTNQSLYLEDTKNKDEFGNIVIHPLPSDWYGDEEVTATQARDECLLKSGASATRDAVDVRIVNEITDGTATYNGSVTGFEGIIDSQNDVGGWGTVPSTPNVLTGDAPYYIPQTIIDEFDLDMTKDYVSAGDPSTMPWKFIFFESGVATNYKTTAPTGWENIVHYHIMEVIQFKHDGQYSLLVSALQSYLLNLTINNALGGTVSKNPNTATVLTSSSVTVTATVNSGYTFQGWYKNGVYQTNILVYSFDMPNEVVNIEARFISSTPIPPTGDKFFAKL